MVSELFFGASHTKNIFKIYTNLFKRKLTIKVKNENGIGLELVTIELDGGNVTFINEKNDAYNTNYPNAWALFNANFGPENNFIGTFRFFEFLFSNSNLHEMFDEQE